MRVSKMPKIKITVCDIDSKLKLTQELFENEFCVNSLMFCKPLFPKNCLTARI